MFKNNEITKMFGIQLPIIQGGMIWASGWRLASAVSNSGGLGLLGAGSMNAQLLREQIRKCKNATSNPFGVNLPLLHKHIEEQIEVVIDEKLKVVFTSAGNPKIWTKVLQDRGIKVVHVVSNVKFAQKSEQAGVDAIVAEGFEAGGHNGREETTTMVLVPAIAESISIPLIAAGGIYNGRTMLAALALGASAVQIGSRFIASQEASSHEKFKQEIINAGEGSTFLAMKKLIPVRLLKNEFALKILEAELEGASKERLSEILGRGRAKSGMFEGNIEQGELEIGQAASYINSIESVKNIILRIISDFEERQNQILMW